MAIVVVGARGQARVLLELMDRAGLGPIAGIVDDDPSLHHTKVDGVVVLGPLEKLPSYARVHRIHRAVIAVGDNVARKRLTEIVRGMGLRFPILIHPGAIVSPTAHLADGAMVLPGAVIGAHAKIGQLTIINTKASVDHDCCLGDFVHIAPGATITGHVTIGDGVFVGAGATVIPETCIGDDSIVGAGAAVIRDVPSRCTVVGVPARVIKTADSSDPQLSNSK